MIFCWFTTKSARVLSCIATKYSPTCLRFLYLATKSVHIETCYCSLNKQIFKCYFTWFFLNFISDLFRTSVYLYIIIIYLHGYNKFQFPRVHLIISADSEKSFFFFIWTSLKCFTCWGSHLKLETYLEQF